MKIIAATPKDSYNTTRYIAELTSDELKALTTFDHHAHIPATDKTGQSQDREVHKLQEGDVIDPDFCKEVFNSIKDLIETRKEIHNYFAYLKGAMTKVQNLIPIKP